MRFHVNILYILILLLLGCNQGDLRHRIETTAIRLYAIERTDTLKFDIVHDSCYLSTDSLIIEWQNSLSWSQNTFLGGAGSPGYNGTYDSIESIKLMKQNSNGIFDITDSVSTCSENLGFMFYPNDWSVKECYSWRFDTIENWSRLLDRYKYENNLFNGKSNFRYICLECPLYLVLHMNKVHKENITHSIYIVIKFRSGREVSSNKVKFVW